MEQEYRASLEDPHSNIDLDEGGGGGGGVRRRRRRK